MFNRRTAGALLLLGVSCCAFGSSGELDAKGCHTDPDTKKYHCHNSALERMGDGGVIVVDRRLKDDPRDDDIYKDCKEVRADGRAPLKLGDIGFSKKLDRNGDGIACD